MSQELTIQLSDAAYAQLELRAISEAKSPGELVVAAIERQFAVPPSSEQSPTTVPENQGSPGLVRTYFGTFDLGYAVGADNESIDADLAREYGSTHEES